MNKSNWLAASVAAVLLSACAADKQPAEQAVDQITNTLNSIHDAAAKYTPEALQSVETQVATLRSSLMKGDYKAVLASAPTVKTAVLNLRQEAESKQAEADAALAKTKQEWRNMSAEVPKMVSELHAQIDTLSKGGRLPKGVTKASLENAKGGVASLDGMWTDATNAETSGDYAGAVTKGQAVKDKAAELRTALGMKSG